MPLLLAAPLSAQMPDRAAWEQLRGTSPRSIFEAAGASCTGGVAKDDGSFENGFRIAFASDARYVQLLTPPEYPSLLTRACVCWKNVDPESMNFAFVVYDDDGPGGQPGTLRGTLPSSVSIAGSFGQSFVGIDCASLDATVDSGGVYVGVQWNAASNSDFFICADESATTPPASMFNSSNGGLSWSPVTFQSAAARALGVRAEFELKEVEDPEPPPGSWLTSPDLPGYQVKALITSGASSRLGTKVDDCIVNTLCVAGAIADQPEIFVRVVGPKPNGYFWPTLIKFNTSQVEIWIQQTSTGIIKYYKLAGSPPGVDTLPGLFDRTGFLP